MQTIISVNNLSPSSFFFHHPPPLFLYFLPSFLPPLLLSSLPSLSPSFLSSFLPSFTFSFLPSFLSSDLPSFLPFILPSFLTYVPLPSSILITPTRLNPYLPFSVSNLSPFLLISLFQQPSSPPLSLHSPLPSFPPLPLRPLTFLGSRPKGLVSCRTQA